jgi:hypothetical protein
MAQTLKKLTINGGGVNDTFINPQIAPDFSTSTAYAIGKYVTYQGQTYRFTAAKTAGAWDATKVTAVNLAGDTDTTLTVSGMAADAKATGDNVCKYFNPTPYSSTNQFGLADMPKNSQTYTTANRFSDAPTEIPGGNYLCITVYASNGGNVRFCTCFDYYAKRMFVCRYVNGYSPTWVRLATYGDTDTTLSASGKPADAEATGAAVSKYFDPTPYSSTNKFGFADMPMNSHTYTTANKFSNIPSGITSDATVNIFSMDANTSNVRLCFCYSQYDKSAFVGRFVSGAITWNRFATGSDIDALSKDIAADRETGLIDLMNPEYGIATYTNETRSGVTFQWNADKTACNISGTASLTTFSNILFYQSALPEYVESGSTISVKCNGISRGGVYLRCYLYPNTLPNRNFEIYEDTNVYIPDTCTGILLRLEVASGTALPSGGVDVSVSVLNGLSKKDIANRFEDEGIKLLVYGSSFTYSTLGLLPAIMQEIAPDRRIILGICYQSGATIQTHITNWNNSTAYPEYSEYDSNIGHWINAANSVTGPQALARHEWDYVGIQQASRYATGEANYTALETFADIISQNAGHPISFLYNLIQALNAGATFPEQYTQPTGREKSDAMFEDMAAYAQRALNDKIISAVIPGGTAVQNARTTSLDSIGAGGDLAEDNLGHLQNGIATLIPAYAAAYKLCEIMGIKPKMFSIPLSPTDAWLAEYLLYTRTEHGTCMGVTEANKLIAQKCAMMAIKHPFEISDMSGY